MGDEGGYAPNLESNEAALSIILEAIDKAGYKAGKDVYLGLDVASFRVLQGRPLRAQRREAPLLGGRVHHVTSRTWPRKFPIITIEDGMSEADWDGWELLTARPRGQDPAGGR